MSLFLILFLTAFVFVFGVALVVGTGILGPKPVQSHRKKRAYESGHLGEGNENSKISVKFYLTALLFILFDIEIIFLYPWAISYSEFLNSGYGLQALVSMGFFLGVFIFGLIWEISSRALEWD